MKNLSEKKRNIISVVLFGVSAALIVSGIMMDEPSVVLHKATAICMQCIGIG